VNVRQFRQTILILKNVWKTNAAIAKKIVDSFVVCMTAAERTGIPAGG